MTHIYLAANRIMPVLYGIPVPTDYAISKLYMADKR